ncbi:hypothetical protein ACFE04_008625 [Oxalis oulophora]
MESCSNNNKEACPKLLDLISKERELSLFEQQRNHHGTTTTTASMEKKLKLKLGPPKDEDWSSSTKQNIFYNNNNQQQTTTVNKNTTTAVPSSNISQKRTAPAPVVGWPPIRSFRKNLATSSSSSKLPNPESQNGISSSNDKIPNDKNPFETVPKKSMLVKINMDGVPIGRKVDLNVYGSYGKLATAVDELFRDLLAAQRDSSAGGIMKTVEDEKAITGVLDGSGEYTLVYEDNEGDRMLVGDVPWQMFALTVKRLRVLKSCDVSALNLGNGKQDRSTAA